MKGVNASRIAALAAGAILLSSSVIAAGVMYENVELVNPNGQPTAKIVVGSGAQISDGIAGANIASVLANYAYKSSTITAEPSVDGELCGGASAGTGAGTCPGLVFPAPAPLRAHGPAGGSHPGCLAGA